MKIMFEPFYQYSDLMKKPMIHCNHWLLNFSLFVISFQVAKLIALDRLQVFQQTALRLC
jgi:hypothetical protein